MKRITLLLALMLWASLGFGQNFTVYDLRCEYEDAPLAVGTATPRFSWKVTSTDRGFMQNGYSIAVAATLKNLADGKNLMWDATYPKSDKTLHIPYAGKTLEVGKEYFWKVQIVDKSGAKSQWSAPAKFAMGLLDEKDWSGAKWIAMEIMPDKQRIVPGLEYNKLQPLGDRTPGINKLPQFRKEVKVNKDVKRAMAYVSGLGQFEFFLNGNKVGDNYMDPAWTDFDKMVCYVPFDVTKQLRKGGNALGVMLGNGFFSVPKERYYKALISYGYPMMILKLVVEYTDGTTSTTVSDASWKCVESPVTYSSIFGGEDYDATKYLKGWMLPDYNDSAWQKVKFTKPRGRLVAPSALPVKVVQEFPTVTIRKTAHGKWLYDLGQNFTGTIRMTVKGKPGQAVVANTAELFNTEVDSITVHGGYRGEYRLTYTIGSDQSETWNPQFTYFGQRYVLVTGAVPKGEDNPEGLPVVENIVGLHMRNSTDAAGSFECSNDLFNKTHTMIGWGIKGNMMNFFTDCPHREKLPWIEQLHLMFGSLQYTFDVYKLYEKMVNDMALAQWENGMIPDITPMYVMFVNGFLDSPEWGSAFILAPWKVYQYYGDMSLIERHYDAMKRYLAYLTSKADNHILAYGLGDWFDIGPSIPGIAQLTSLAGTATPMYYMDAVTMSQSAKLLGKDQDAVYFTKLAEDIKTAYNDRYFNKEGQYYDRNSQCANSIALYAGMADPQYKDGILANVVKDVRARGNGLSAGDVGYNYVLRTLESNDASDVIYDMNSRYDVYGYGYMLGKGSTSLPESWNVVINKSHSHFMLGHLQEWFYSSVGGVAMDASALAFKKIVIKPAVVGGLTFANVRFESPYGAISNRWAKTQEGFEMNVEIPANTEAVVWVPASENDRVTESGVDVASVSGVKYDGYQKGYKKYSVGSGTYRFKVDSLVE